MTTDEKLARAEEHIKRLATIVGVQIDFTDDIEERLTRLERKTDDLARRVRR